MSEAEVHQSTEAQAEEVHQRVIEAQLGEMTELESMCPKCEQNGITRLMITKIPHFREVIVSSFECKNPDCLEQNNEIQFGGEFGEKHVTYELSVEDAKDLNRQVVKSEYAHVYIPELELEIPANSQKGQLNTVEGMLMVCCEGLQQEQPVRRITQPELAQKIDEFCERLERYRSGELKFHFHIVDPAGNSYIEAIHDYYHPTLDAKLTKFERWRTNIERQLLGLAVEYDENKRTAAEERHLDEGQIGDEVVEIVQECPACTKDGMLRCHKCDIPYFKETLIMCFKCDMCGYKSTEIKNGGSVSPKGIRKTLKVLNSSDLVRDVLKSDSCTVFIPELELELAPGTLGGFFTTVEGVLSQVHDHLSGTQQMAFESGDAIAFDTTKNASTMKLFLEELAAHRDGLRFPFTLILDDPLANIYVQNPRSHLPPPNNEDPQLETVEYERTAEMDEELGILALKEMELRVNADHAEAATSS